MLTPSGDTDPSAHFKEQLYYNAPLSGVTPQYGGNISRQSWQHGSAPEQRYTYRYDALDRLVHGSMGSSMGRKTLRYDRMGNITHLGQYEDGILSLIHMEEGRIIKSGGSYTYEYTLQDHLGNMRSGFRHTAPGSATLRSDYYPFGLQYQQNILAGNPQNRYLYNGKELQDGLGIYDYSYSCLS